MTHSEPESETEDPANLRNAAVKALQSAVRQKDPHEFDRLTRHALRLLQRARAIGHGLRARSGEAPALQEENNEMQKTEDIGESSKLRVKFTDTLCRLFSWRSR